MATKATKTVTEPVVQTEPKATKSARIRELFAQGKTRSEIVKIMTAETGKPIKYQHVRNVLVTPMKRKDTDTAKA